MFRKKYQVFTPDATVAYMLNRIKYSGHSIIQKRIIDISCGDGAFLCMAAKRLIVACKNAGIDNKSISKICIDNIWGVEIDEEYYGKCIQKLNAIIRDYLGINFIKWKNIRKGDGLLLEESGFDYVVGNPPYISFKDMSIKQREFLSNTFLSCKFGRFDYSFAFIEKSISILSDSGTGCIISPINMYKIKSGESIKELLRPHLTEIVDVTEGNIFPRVLTNPVISVFGPINTNPVVIKKKGRCNRSVDKSCFEDNITPYRNTGSKRFGDYFEVHNGVATLLNEAYLVDCDCQIESAILKNARSPKYERYGTRKGIIFPYQTNSGGKIERISESHFKEKYPLGYNHLLSFKDKLVKRNISNDTKWFEYGRTQAIGKMNCDKIMVPAIISEGVKPVLLDKNDVVFAGFYIIAKNPKEHPLQEAMELLSNNSALFKYIKRFGVKMNGFSYRYSASLLEDYLFD